MNFRSGKISWRRLGGSEGAIVELPASHDRRRTAGRCSGRKAGLLAAVEQEPGSKNEKARFRGPLSFLFSTNAPVSAGRSVWFGSARLDL